MAGRIKTTKRPTPEELRSWMERHDVSQGELARRAGVGLRTIARWANDPDHPRHAMYARAVLEIMDAADREASLRENGAADS